MTSSNTQSEERNNTSERGSTSTVNKQADAYIRTTLPKGWQNYWVARKCGKYWGIHIVCPTCQIRAPKEVKPWARWKWMCDHSVRNRH